jgi:DNA-binding transcriptional regulator YiaG
MNAHDKVLLVATVQRMCAKGEVKAIRVAAGVGTRPAAASIGVTRARLIKWEHGCIPKAENAIRFGEFLVACAGSLN